MVGTPSKNLLSNKENTKKSVPYKQKQPPEKKQISKRVIGFPAHLVARYSFLALLLVFLYITFLVIKPYTSYLLLGLVLAYATYPLYIRLLKWFKNSDLASAVTLVIIIIIVIIPLYFLTAKIIAEAGGVYKTIKTGLSYNMTDSLIGGALNTLGIEQEFFGITINLAKTITHVIINNTTSLLANIPRFLAGMVLMLFVIFYSLKDGKTVYDWLKRYFPLRKDHRIRFLDDVKLTTKAIVYSQFLSALAQAITAGIGYWLFGIGEPVFWAFVTFIIAFIPLIGPSLVWIPMCIIKLLQGDVLQSVLLFAWGMIIISNVDNIVRMKFLQHETKVHGLLMLIGFLGGVQLWGFAGILLGPLVLTIMVKLLNFYTEEFEGL